MRDSFTTLIGRHPANSLPLPKEYMELWEQGRDRDGLPLRVLYLVIQPLAKGIKGGGYERSTGDVWVLSQADQSLQDTSFMHQLGRAWVHKEYGKPKTDKAFWLQERISINAARRLSYVWNIEHMVREKDLKGAMGLIEGRMGGG